MTDSYFARQLAAYGRAHQNRVNLALHLAFVPVFIGGALLLPVALVTGSLQLLAIGAGLAATSIGIQGRGHAREAQRVRFTGPVDFVTRILTEQLVTFPRFVLGGGFARAWRAAPAGYSKKPIAA